MHVTILLVRLTEFWQRMTDVLGEAYVSYWADSHVLPELHGRTVSQALAEGEDTQTVWRAVHANLHLPAHLR